MSTPPETISTSFRGLLKQTHQLRQRSLGKSKSWDVIKHRAPMGLPQPYLKAEIFMFFFSRVRYSEAVNSFKYLGSLITSGGVENKLTALVVKFFPNLQYSQRHHDILPPLDGRLNSATVCSVFHHVCVK